MILLLHEEEAVGVVCESTQRGGSLARSWLWGLCVKAHGDNYCVVSSLVRLIDAVVSGAGGARLYVRCGIQFARRRASASRYTVGYSYKF